MDSILKEQQRNTQFFPKSYTNERIKAKINVTRKNIAFQQYLRDDEYSHDAFPAQYQTLSFGQNGFENSSPYEEKKNSEQETKSNMNPKCHVDNSEETIVIPQDNSTGIYSHTKRVYVARPDPEKYIVKTRPKLETDREHTYFTAFRHQQCKDQQCQNPNKQIIYQNKAYEMASGSSYICEPINNKRDTVRINDIVVKDNLIFSCKPRQHGEHHQKLYVKPNNEEVRAIDSINSYIQSHAEELKADNVYEQRNYGPYIPQTSHIIVNEPPLLSCDTVEKGGSSVIERHNLFNTNLNKNTEVERKIFCTNISKKFKRNLWILFISNIFLVVVGLTLMALAMSHFINRNYINIVIEQRGFAVWVWVILVISVCLFVIGVYGILTSVERGKRILIAYCIAAFILAFLILVFLVFLWVMFVNMQGVELESMRNTFKRYRCSRYIRTAWDSLQETHKCCGIDDKRNWKYIPTSCCNATEKRQKMACVNYFISNSLAYEGGCKSELQYYFTELFLVAACFLLLAFFLLLLSVFASLWLLKKYTKVVKCQEVYYISR